MDISKKHKTFADAYLKDQDITKAYLAAYPDSSLAAARTGGYKILKKDNVVNYIKSFSSDIAQKAKDKLLDELSDEELSKLLTFNKKRLLLSKIANSEIEVEDVVVIQNQPETIKRKPTTIEIIKAIEADNKMTGDIAPSKIAQTDPEGKAIEIKGNTAIFKIDLNAAI